MALHVRSHFLIVQKYLNNLKLFPDNTISSLKVMAFSFLYSLGRLDFLLYDLIR